MKKLLLGILLGLSIFTLGQEIKMKADTIIMDSDTISMNIENMYIINLSNETLIYKLSNRNDFYFETSSKIIAYKIKNGETKFMTDEGNHYTLILDYQRCYLKIEDIILVGKCKVDYSLFE